MNPSRPILALSGDDRKRLERVEALVVGGPASIPELVAMLGDSSWVVRRAVVGGLARVGSPAPAALADVLIRDRGDETRIAAAVDALVLSTTDIDAAIAEMVATERPELLCDAAQVLGRRRASHRVDLLARLASHADGNVALAALEALGRIGGGAAVDVLIAAVNGGNFFRAFPAMDALGRTGDPRAVAPLVRLLSSGAYGVEAVRSLGRAGQLSAIPALSTLLDKASEVQTRAAAVAIAEIEERHAERFGPGDDVARVLRVSATPGATRRLVHCMEGADAAEQGALCRVLGWLGGSTAAESLVDLLDADPSTARAAAEALAELGPGAQDQMLFALRTATSERKLMLLPLLARRSVATDDFVACLSDPNPGVRALACDALAGSGDPSVVPSLFALIGDPDARASHAAVAAIQSLGSKETQRLALEAATSKDARVRRAALRILAYFGFGAAIDVLLRACTEQDERIRETALAGLATSDDPRVIATLLEGADHPSARTRSTAIRTLGQNTMAASQGVPRLRKALSDGDPWVRYYSAQALGRLGDEASAEPIAALVDDAAGQVRVAAIEALAHLRGERGISILHDAARSIDRDVARAALLALGMVKHPSSLPVLLDACRSSDAATRLVALSGLAAFDAPAVVPALREAAADAEDTVRKAAVGLLEERPGDEPALALMELARTSPVAATAATAAAALGRAAPGRVEALSRMLRSADAEGATLIVNALTRMRRGEALAALTEAFDFDNVAARRAAASALASHGGAMVRPLLTRVAARDSDPQVRDICRAADPS